MEKTVRLLFAILLCAFARVPLWAQNTLDKAGLTSATPAAVAYSVRQLSSSYTGYALQVRRSSDNTTQDIGFTTNGDLDTTALKSFVGTGNGYVTIWYDQSGNGRNATQTTTSQQPAIVLSGVVQRANSQPAVVFDGVSQTMASAAFGLINQPFSRNSVVKALSYGYYPNILSSAGGNPTTSLWLSSATQVSMWAGNQGAGQTVSLGSTNIYTEQYNGNASVLVKNGNVSSSVNPGSNGVNGVQIGSKTGSTQFSNVAISEIILFPNLLSNGDRQNLETNQEIYYYISNSNNLILNTTYAIAAYSTRKLSDNYSGFCIRVRRSSDNSTADIGFTANGDLDTVGLKNFVGSGNGFVSIWYDQSGNQNNAFQNSTSQQPNIVINGVVQRVNNRPAVLFDGVSQTMASAAFGLISQPFSRNSVVKALSYGYYPNILSSAGGNPTTSLYMPSSSEVGMWAGNAGPSQINTIGSTNIYTEQYNGSSSVLVKNGTSSVSINPGSNGVNGIQIGSKNGTSQFSNVAIPEILLFPTLLSPGNRQAIEINQENYYIVNNDLILNIASGSAAYSVRLLNSNYTGYALQVRRSSDNATQDIGFTTNGDLDTAALKSFVGTGNGYVTIWYDQSGNGRNATQTTTSKQPAIVLSGVVQRANSQPAVVFDGVSQTMASEAFGLINQPFSRNSVVKALSYGYYPNILSSAGGNPTTSLWLSSATQVSMWAGNQGAGQTVALGSTNIFTEQYNGNASVLVKNGNVSSSVNPGSNGVNGVQIGSKTGSTQFSNVAISEIILFPNLLSNGDRQNLETNQGNYYGINTVGTTTWTGLNSNNWADAGNWTNGVPNLTVSAIIPNVSPLPFPTINATAFTSNLTINSGATLTVNNTLQIGGSLVNNGNISNNNLLTVQGNVQNTGNISGSITLNGISNQTIGGGGTFYTLNINNSSSDVVNLSSDIQINNLLNVTTGTFNLNNYNITLKSTSITNTAQVGNLGGTILFPGSGRFIIERIIATIDNSLDSNGYRTLTAPVISDNSIWANWQEGATTANYNPNPGYGTQITGLANPTQGVDPTTGLDYSRTGNYSLWYWDYVSQNYVPITNTKQNSLSGYKGYLIIIRGNRSYDLYNRYASGRFNSAILRAKGKILSGTIIYNSTNGISYQVGSSATFNDNAYKLSNLSDTGYSLIGNPYASAFDFTQATANSGVSGIIKTQYSYWDGPTGQYVTWDAATGPDVSGSLATKYIQPGQAFFIQNDATNNVRQFVVTEANKNTNPANLTGVFAQSTPMSKLYFTLLNAQGQIRDGALLAQRSDFNNQSIIGEDAHKFRNPAENMAFRIQQKNWSIQKIQQLAVGDTLPIAIWNLSINQPYTLVAAGEQIPAGWAVYDAYTQKTYPVHNGDTLRLSFTPTADTATYLHRFSVVRTEALPNASVIGLQVQAINGGYHLLGSAPATLAITGPDYTFERSTDSLHFMPVGQVSNVHDSAFGYVDAPAPKGALWYRIRALAADRTLYSNTVRVMTNGNDMRIRIYPNPSDGQSIALATENLPAGLYTIQLYNNNGQRVYANQISIANGASAQALQWNTRLAAGTYYLQLSSVQNPSVQFTQTLIIQNH